MALKKLPYRRVHPLVRDWLSAEEDAPTAALIRGLRPAVRRGHLTPSELQGTCRWKSAAPFSRSSATALR